MLVTRYMLLDLCHGVMYTLYNPWLDSGFVKTCFIKQYKRYITLFSLTRKNEKKGRKLYFPKPKKNSKEKYALLGRFTYGIICQELSQI